MCRYSLMYISGFSNIYIYIYIYSYNIYIYIYTRQKGNYLKIARVAPGLTSTAVSF